MPLLPLLAGLLACVRAPVVPTAGIEPPLGAEPAPEPRTLEPVEALTAFAHLYGVVRWFHPSDAAANADWDAVAVAGVETAMAARSPEDLARRLTALLGPLAPTLQLWRDGEPAPAPVVVPSPGPAVAWEHLGWSFGGDQPIYESVRAGRGGLPVHGTEGTAVNGDEADDVRGRRLRVSARTRVEGDAQAFLWLRLDHGPDDAAASRTGWDAPALTEDTWTSHTVTAEVPADATWYVFGVRLTGKGALYADDFRVEVQEPDGAWRDVQVRDGGFDDPERWWNFGGFGYDATVVEDGGGPVLRLAHPELGEPPTAELEVGEAFEGPIGAGLAARVPLALPWTPEEAAGERVALADRDDRAVRVAAALVAWNVLRHFYPYGEDVPVDWEGALQRALAGAMAAEDRQALVEVLWRLQVDVPDGHAWVGHRVAVGRQCGLPVRWVAVGEPAGINGTVPAGSPPPGGGDGSSRTALVVTTSVEPALRTGDRVVAVDGMPVADALARARTHVSGSSQFRDAFAAERLAMGRCGESVSVQVARGAVVTLTHERSALPLFDHPGIEEVPGGIFLVDLNQVPWSVLEKELPALARARGVVFDLREYPATDTVRLLAHLMDRPDEARGWMRVPRILRPGEIAGWEPHEWGLLPETPKVRGKVVFLTSSLAISAAESMLGMVKGEGLGTLIGEPTAGTNGNATGAILPGGYWIQFTGMRVVNVDGSAFHLRGIAPDVSVAPTLAGLLAGKDEVRDAAVAFTRSTTRPPGTVAPSPDRPAAR